MADRIFACPDSGEVLHPDSGFFAARRSDRKYPILSGIPILYRNPSSFLSAWKRVAKKERLAAVQRVLSIKSQLRGDPLLPSTRARLETLASALEDRWKFTDEVLTPLRNAPEEATDDGFTFPGQGSLASRFSYLLRDWSWQTEENEERLRAVTQLLPNSPTPDILTLGAGACRLPYDIHRLLTPSLSVALDFNPLLIFAAARILRGEALQVPEIPLDPDHAEHAAISRQCQAPQTLQNSLQLVLADAAHPPFRRETFDLVITSYLLDVLSVDLPRFFGAVRVLLKPGGSWLNVGPLLFRDVKDTHRFSVEEIHDLVIAAGFELANKFEVWQRHACSPSDQHRAQLLTYCFCARRSDKTRK